MIYFCDIFVRLKEQADNDQSGREIWMRVIEFPALCELF
jgi:hypothetical protein